MVSPLVDFYVHGRGRGHGTRSKVLCETLLSAGYRVRVYAGPGAQPAFDSIPSVAVDSLLPSMRVEALSLLRTRLRLAKESIRKERPSCIVSDGDLPGLLHAKRFKIPSIAVGHGLVFSHAKSPEGVSSDAWRREGMKSKLSSVGSTLQLAVNFVSLEPKSHSTRVVRPTFQTPIARIENHQNKEVVCYFRDDNGDAIVRHLVSEGFKPLLFSRNAVSIPGVKHLFPDTGTFRNALASAAAVVSSAGSQLISECLSAGIPHFPFYKEADLELFGSAKASNMFLNDRSSNAASTARKMQLARVLATNRGAESKVSLRKHRPSRSSASGRVEAVRSIQQT